MYILVVIIIMIFKKPKYLEYTRRKKIMDSQVNIMLVQPLRQPLLFGCAASNPLKSQPMTVWYITVISINKVNCKEKMDHYVRSWINLHMVLIKTKYRPHLYLLLSNLLSLASTGFA